MKYTPIAVLMVLFFLDIPVAFAILGASLYYFLFLNSFVSINSIIIQQLSSSLQSFPYLAVPFFIMMGSIMNRSGISNSLMKMG